MWDNYVKIVGNNTHNVLIQPTEDWKQITHTHLFNSVWDGRATVFSCHGSHVEVVGVDFWDGPLWSETHSQPLRRTRTQEENKESPLVLGSFPRFPHGPVLESQGSTPVCRPCRLGSTWRRRSRWGTPQWCSSQGTCSQTALAVVPSGGSWWW